MTIGDAHTIHAHQRHHGWSRDAEPVYRATPGEVVELEVIDASGGAITPETTVDDLAAIDFSKMLPLTGPIHLDGAEPGDAIKATILAFAPSGWGWSAVTTNFGILADQFPDPALKIWTYDPADPTSAMYNDIARVPLKPFPGVIGVAPGEAGVHSALPPRRVGGNLDIRDLTVGAELHLPVEVPGALLSIGDTHAAQGDGELAGTAIESPMSVTVKLELEKDARLPGPWFDTPGPTRDHVDGDGYHVTAGVATDLMEAARTATSNMIDLLGRLHQLAPEDAYLLCSVCADLRISEIVDAPNWLVSLYFPRLVLE